MPAVLRLNIHKNPASHTFSLGFPHWLGDSPRCSQSLHNHSHGAHGPVIRDPSYSEVLRECPPRSWYSPEIDTSKFTLHILSDTPGGSQRLKYILLMHASHEWGVSIRDLVLTLRTMCNAGHCFGITYHFYRSDLVHLGANWVVLMLSQLCNHPTQLPTPSSWRITLK